MFDGSEKRPLTKMLWSVSIKTRTFASVNTCNGSFLSCLKLLKQYRTIERMCSDAHSITFIQKNPIALYVKIYKPDLDIINHESIINIQYAITVGII